jgi:uncharacterized damage-inducible protein DinB
MPIAESLLHRLDTQLGALDTLTGLGGSIEAAWDARPSPDEWSAREHLAHLARHATVFRERLGRILTEDRPALGRYQAEQDPEWPEWQGLSVSESRARLASAQSRLAAWARGLTADETLRAGVHPTFGEMPVARWLDFFLLHQGHHLYVALIRIAEARRGRDPGRR